jgi:acetyl esterase/lipase
VGKLYTPDGLPAGKEHLAFPHHATVEQLKGLVPTVVLVNEFDPLRDEGWLDVVAL